MIKNLTLLFITILLFGCKQNEGKSNSIDTGTSNNKSIILNDSIPKNKKYNIDEIIKINKLIYQKTDSTLITGEVPFFMKPAKLNNCKPSKTEY